PPSLQPRRRDHGGADPRRRLGAGARPRRAPQRSPRQRARRQHVRHHPRGRDAPRGGSMKRLALLAIVAAAPARANPVDAYGLGARNPAMGGAATASTDSDSSATYYNPAAIAAADAIRIDLGYQAAMPALTINGGDQGVDPAHGLVAGLVMPGHVGGLKIAFGAAVLLLDERVIRLRTYPSDQPRWMYYDNRPQRFFLATSLALELTD